MPKVENIKKPTVSGIDPNFKITLDDCKKRIDFVLNGLKIQHWTKVVKLGKYALKTIRSYSLQNQPQE